MGCWTVASAQSLGTPAADLWVGQPLRMTVPASFVDGEGGGECVHADVFYGEHRLGTSAVRATVVGPQDGRRVRIEADAPIDEPVVTVSLRAGCRNSVTRNYTLLPDIAPESVIAAMVRGQAPALVTAAAPLPLRMATAAAPSSGPRVRPPRIERAVAHADAAAPARLRTGMRARHDAMPNVAARGAHLRMEPVDIPPEAFLRVTAALADPQGDASRRATAAMLWQAINADPQDLLRTSAMLQKLEGDLAQLRQTAGATHSEMAALRQRIEQRQAQPWYASALTIQVLALMVLCAAAAAGVLWWRTRGLVGAAQPWYERGAAEPLATAGESAAVAVAPVAAFVPVAAPVAVPAPVAPQERRAEPVALAVTTTPTPIPAYVPAAPGVVEHAVDFELPRAAVGRAGNGVLRVETLAATFEEVEFLSSLGLSADAMDVVTAYLQDSSSPAPLAYFEFMRLCDQAEDPQALATVRRRYTKVFGVPAPTLEQVTAPKGIDAVGSLGARITRAWGSAEVLELVEQALFSVPPADAMLTLQAGRELLCLHELAMAMLAEDGAAHPGGMAAESHPVAPWAHAEDPGAAEALAQAFVDADGGRQFALDVDLDAAPEPLPEQEQVQPQPQPQVPELELELEPILTEAEEAELREAARRNAAARAQAEAEEAFSAAVALERAPSSRY